MGKDLQEASQGAWDTQREQGKPATMSFYGMWVVFTFTSSCEHLT